MIIGVVTARIFNDPSVLVATANDKLRRCPVQIDCQFAKRESQTIVDFSSLIHQWSCSLNVWILRVGSDKTGNRDGSIVGCSIARRIGQAILVKSNDVRTKLWNRNGIWRCAGACVDSCIDLPSRWCPDSD